VPVPNGDGEAFLSAPTVKDLAGLPEQVPAVPLSRPRTVAGYTVLAELGRGGMGVVYLARQTALNRLVALKMMLSARACSKDLERFRSEALAVARLRHPNIVQIYEVGEQDGQPFFSLEFCEGGSLENRLGGRALPTVQAACLVLTLARAVQAAHEAGVIHRDLKPANVLLQKSEVRSQRSGAASSDLCPLTSDLCVKITDFGLAKQLDGQEPIPAGLVAGTPKYMAPEQARGHNGDIGPACDLYALGVILYELLTGKPPFNGETAQDTLRQVCGQEPVPPRRRQGKVPRDLETICLKCLRKSPQERYASAADLAEDLRRFLDGEPVRARPVGPAGRVAKWARRRPAAAALVLVSLLVALGVATAIPWHIARLERKVAESNAEVLRQRDASRRAHLRADCHRELSEGRNALMRPEGSGLEDARVLFATVRGKIDARDAQEDPELGRLRTEANNLIAEVTRLLHQRSAQQRAREFFSWRDEAFFQLNRNVLDGPHAAGPRASREAARKALKVFPHLDHVSPAEKERLLAGRLEVMLILAEAIARPASSEPAERREQAGEALGILAEAGGFPGPMQAVHRRRARYLEQLGDSAGAAEERAKAAALLPVNALDWFLAGYDRWLAGNVAGAVKDFDRALGLDADLFWAHFFRAVGYQHLNNASEARASLTVCIGKRPDFIWLYLLRGFLYEYEPGRDFEAAEKDFRKAESLHPDRFARYVLHVNRGVLALRRDQTSKAVAEFQQAVRERADGYHAHANLAEAYRRRGERARAAEELAWAIRLEPKRPELYRTRARLRLERNDSAGALADLDEAIRLGTTVPEPRGESQAPALAGDHLERGLILYRAHKYEEVVRACDAALRVWPGGPDAYRLRGEALLRLGRYRDAADAFDRCLAKGKPEADIFRQRALARSALGNHSGAIGDYTQALTLRPQDARLLAARGWAYLVTEAPQPALHDFDQALKIEPNSADAHNGRGFARVRLGQVRQGVAEAEEALRRGPRLPQLLYNAARTFAQAAAAEQRARPPRPLARAADEERALALLREALDRMPARERPGFWAHIVRQDAAFSPIAHGNGFKRLELEYRRGSEE
jgi:tetratricopeptide (TPR) repeat protein